MPKCSESVRFQLQERWHLQVEKDADESVLIGVNRIQIIRFFAMPLDRMLKVGFSELTKPVLQDDVLRCLCIICEQNSDENMALRL